MQNAKSYFQENSSWSLIDYLKYRENSLDFDDRSREHRAYAKVLENMLQDKSEEWCTKAEVTLKQFESEKSSAAVSAFWDSVYRRRYERDIELLQLKYTKSALMDIMSEMEQIRATVADKSIKTLKHALSGGETSNKQKRQKNGEEEV
ncbi:10056_t:CDS:2 [Paraglomus brasilianum]|uniref:10056_t:CDS:1 n=1 Tax=Paraglomus brasilianum TaxID=144538 RepID=A0A9N9A068_9GLOM|nr:10056_t:CDS:2 [Paraglomus brasilianum]